MEEALRYETAKKLHTLGSAIGPEYRAKHSGWEYILREGQGPRLPGCQNSRQCRFDFEPRGGYGVPQTWVFWYGNSGNGEHLVGSKRIKGVNGKKIEVGPVREGDSIFLMETLQFLARHYNESTKQFSVLRQSR